MKRLLLESDKSIIRGGYFIFNSYLGFGLAAAAKGAIIRIDLDDSSDRLYDRLRAFFPQVVFEEKEPLNEPLFEMVLALVEDPGRSGILPVALYGTDFQKRVWSILRSIPSGKTISYKNIGVQMGSAASARAVARACSANSIAIAVPCHRAVYASGKLGGYRWGIERKRALLIKESGE